MRQESYVDASIAMGRNSFGTILVHILPNIAGPLIVMTTIWIGTAIRLEASLSFIGLGAQAPAPSWGNVREGASNLFNSPPPALSPVSPLRSPCLLSTSSGCLARPLHPDRTTR